MAVILHDLMQATEVQLHQHQHKQIVKFITNYFYYCNQVHISIVNF